MSVLNSVKDVLATIIKYNLLFFVYDLIFGLEVIILLWENVTNVLIQRETYMFMRTYTYDALFDFIIND